MASIFKLSFVFGCLFVFTLGRISAQNKIAPAKQIEMIGELSEAQKIDKLIAYIAVTEAKFIRNSIEYSGVDAAKHLRMKREKAGKKIITARQFIDYLASKSSMSGEPYLMKFKNGTTLPVRDILYHQLKKLETNQTSVN
jgi:hypothetical protein